MKHARQITLTDDERKTLECWSRGRRTPSRLVLRSRIVLLAADGMMNKDIAKALKTAPKTVSLWRTRFAERRLAGIEKDSPRGGRPPQARERIAREIIAKTTQERPANATHWSTRTLAKALGTSPAMVQRVWKANGLQPQRTKTFKLSNDPHFAEKLLDVVGLYLDPPDHALVLCADEKTSIQALDRTQRGLPIHPGRCGTMTADYKRNGTTTLFAAIEMAEGKLIGTCMSQASASGMDQVLEADRRRNACRVGLALDRGQLRDAQASEGEVVAEAAFSVPHALHSHEQFVVESDRALVPRNHDQAVASRHVPQRRAIDRSHRIVHPGTQPQPSSLHLDRQSRRNPRQNRACPKSPP